MSTLDQTMSALRAEVETALADVSLQYKVYRGHPIPETLTNDLRNKIVHVSVAPSPGGERSMDEMSTALDQVSEPVVDLTATKTGNQLNAASTAVPATGSFTLAGSILAGTHTMTQIGSVYVPYTPVVGDTPDVVATAIADAINAHAEANLLVTAVAAAETVTLTTVSNAVLGQRVAFDFKIGGTANFAEEVGRRDAEFHINVYGYDDPSRALVSNTLDIALAALKFVTPSDGVPAELVFKRSLTTDRELSHVVYRRTLVYSVQYTQTALTTGYQVLAGLVRVLSGG